MRVKEVGRDELAGVLTAAHAVWGRGLGLDDFLAFHLALADAPWGRAHSRYLAGADDAGRTLGALRIDSHAGHLDGARVSIAQIGMLFTVTEARGRGHASALVEQALAHARRGGHDLALLVSKIPQSLYGRLGFRVLPASEVACRSVLPAPWPAEPAWLRAGEEAVGRVAGLRPGTEGDVAAIAAIHAGETAGQRLRIERDAAAWGFDLQKARMPGGRAREEDRFWVIERRGRVEAYVLLQAEPPTLRWREHGALAGARDLLSDLFWCAVSVARRRRQDRIEGWFMPEVLTLEPLYPASQRSRKTNLVMLRVLEPANAPPVFAREDECRLWELDAL